MSKWENTWTPNLRVSLPRQAHRHGYRRVHEGCGILEGLTHTLPWALPKKQPHLGVASVTHSAATPT